MQIKEADDRAALLAQAFVELAGALSNGYDVGQRTISRSGEVAEQLQTALDSRVVIEQAKGVLAQQGGRTKTAAFDVLRRHARRNNQRVTDAARAVVESTLSLEAMTLEATSRLHGARTPR